MGVIPIPFPIAREPRKDARVYVPQLLVSELLASNDLTAEFHAAIVFTDIVDSMTLMNNYLASRTLGAERLGQVLNEYYADLFNIVHAYGGQVVRLDGDAMIALWKRRADQDENTHVKAAAVAAWALKSHFLRTDKDLSDFSHRVALACGDLTAEIIQANEGRAFIAMQGQPLSELRGPLASGKPSTIRLNDDAAKILGDAVSTECTDNGVKQVARLHLQESAFRQDPSHEFITKSETGKRLLSPFVRERLERGLADWIAERRVASVAQVGIRSSKGTKLSVAIETIQNTLAGLDAGIWDVTISDKGPVVTVIFGLPPFSKLTAAKWTVQAVEAISDNLKLEGANVKIGVASGELLLGDVGSETRRSEFLLGSVMARATRLMQASSGEVLCDQQTVEQCSGRFDFGPPQEVIIKAKEPPILAQAALAQSLSDGLDVFSEPVIGRKAEKDLIEKFFEERRSNDARCLILKGEPGSGKSHLLRDATKVAENFGHRVLNVTCNPIDSTSPHFAFRTILPRLLGLDPNDPGRRLEATIVLALDGHHLSRNPAAVEAAAEIVTNSKVSGSVAAEARASLAEDVVVELFRPISAVVIVDDAQWLDSASSHLLRALIERVDGMRLLAATRRKEDGAYLPEWLTEQAEIATLDRLNGEDIDALARRLLDVFELPKQLSELIQKRSDGIPLFAEQIIFDLKQRNLVSVNNNRVAFRIGDISTPSQPSSLRELIANRVDLLSHREQIILKAASVMGREFSIDTLMKISPVAIDRSYLQEAADHFVRNGFIDFVLPNAKNWRFRHRMIRDCVYGMLTRTQRRPLHAAIAQTLLDDKPVDRSAILGTLAEHFEGADDFSNAISYGTEAAAFALSRFANADALARLDRVRHLVEEIPDTDQRLQLAKVEFLAARAYQGLSRFGDAARHYKQFARAQGLRLPTSRKAILAKLPFEVVEQILHRAGFLGKFGASPKQVLARQQAQMFTDHAEHAYFKNDSLRLLYYTITSLNRAERAQLVDEVALGLGAMSIGLCAAGLHGLSGHYQELSERVLSKSNDDALRGFVYLLGAVALSAAANWPEEKRLVRAGIKTSTATGDSFRAQSCNAILAYSLLWRGSIEAAEKLFLAYGANAEGIANTSVRAWFRAGIALLQIIREEPLSPSLQALSVADDPELSSAERLLCRSVRSGVLLKLDRLDEALQEASAVLAEMKDSQVTLGITLDGITAVALVHLNHLENRGFGDRNHLANARDACKVALKFSRQTLAGKSRAYWLQAKLDHYLGRKKSTQKKLRKSLAEARRHGIRLDEAAALASLGQLVGDDRFILEAVGIVEDVGAKPWFLDASLKQLIDPGIDKKVGEI